MNQKSNLWVLLLLILLLVAAVALLLHALFKPLPAAPQKPAPTAAQEAAEPAASPAETAPQVSETSPKKAELIRRLKETFGQVFPERDSTRLALFYTAPFSGPQIARLRAQKILQQRTEPVDEKVLEQMWQQAGQLLTQYREARKTNPPGNIWKETDCASLPLPKTEQGITLTCHTSAAAFCAFFENGRPFYCRLTNGSLELQSNRWGSSLTLTRYDNALRPLFQRYYANGTLGRSVDFNYTKNQVTRVWMDKDQIRLYQENTSGKILNKFYFRPGKPYIQYPQGNDMGERNGPWEEKDGRIYIDGVFLYTLPASRTQPDFCTLFAGVCRQGTQPAEELL